MHVVTRIAPSPTGRMHIGTVRTALFNYLFAKHHGGTYFARIEDTDRARSKDEWTDLIWKDFEWCGIVPDARFVQSEHRERHRALLSSLIESGKAYVSPEPSRDDPSKSVEVVRLKNPGASITFDDLIRGPVTFDTTELGDFVIARSVDDPLYHFAVVSDDAEAGVTHILRAEEHISNTPRQILIQEALGLPRPLYGHLPLILAPDRSKLSKRKHAASIENYREQGFLAPAVVNYLGLLGWTPPSGREVMSLPEMVAEFDLADVHKSGAVFDIEKLRWYNRHYLLALPSADFQAEGLRRIGDALSGRVPWDERMGERILPIVQERISTWSDAEDLAKNGELDFFFAAPKLDTGRIPNKGDEASAARKHLAHIKDLLTAVPSEEYATAEDIKAAVWDYATEEGRGSVLWPLRYTLSGRERSPDPFTIASMIGKEETLRRIEHAIKLLGV